MSVWKIWIYACACSWGYVAGICEERPWLNHYANETISPRVCPICIASHHESPISLMLFVCFFFLFFFSVCSMTMRAAASATCRLTFPWCGTGTLSLTTRSTFKVREQFLFLPFLFYYFSFVFSSVKHTTICLLTIK